MSILFRLYKTKFHNEIGSGKILMTTYGNKIPFPVKTEIHTSSQANRIAWKCNSKICFFVKIIENHQKITKIHRYSRKLSNFMKQREFKDVRKIKIFKILTPNSTGLRNCVSKISISRIFQIQKFSKIMLRFGNGQFKIFSKKSFRRVKYGPVK